MTSNYQRRVTWETDYTQYQDNAFFGNPWPLTGAADDYGTGYYETYQNVTSEELRFSSVNPDDRFVWVAGLYYEHASQQDTVFVVASGPACAGPVDLRAVHREHPGRRTVSGPVGGVRRCAHAR